MRMHHTAKYGLMFIITGLVGSVVQGQVDRAEAAGDMAAIATMSVESKANVASDALSGDVDAIAESSKRSDAVDAAGAAGQQAYSQVEKAVASGDNDAAASANEDLKASVQKAKDALNGVIPESVLKSAQDVWKEAQTNTGGGPGKAYDPPNIWKRPHETSFQQSVMGGLGGNVNAASSGGGGGGFGGFLGNGGDIGDGDATPQ